MSKRTLIFEKCIFVGISSLLMLNAYSADLRDMVYVSAPDPFYIKIFEASFNDENGNKADDSKPARMEFDEAKVYCQRNGLRLPTMNEWLAAATNLGRNTQYSLIGDEITDSNQTLKVNIRNIYGSSVKTKEFNKIGIDSIGTVGMTGNRDEWVIGPSGTEYKCGGAYETLSINDVHLSKICRSKFDDHATSKATARCVLNFDISDTINFSNYVKGNLSTYLQSINYGFSNNSRMAPSVGEKAKLDNQSKTMNTLNIDDDESEFN